MEDQKNANVVSQESPHTAPLNGEKEFTVRAVLWGIVIGILLLGVYMALQIMTGIGVGMSPVAALLGLILLPIIGGKASKKEINIVQTISSAVTVGGAVVTNTIAAMLMGGAEFDFVAFVTSILLPGIVGICMVSLFRKRMVEDKSLPFPQAIACLSVVEKVENTSKKEKLILLVSILAGIGISALYNFGIIPMSVSLNSITPKGMLLGISFMPLLFGIGYLIGFKISAVMMIGAVLSNIVLSAIGTSAGWYPDPATAEGAGAMQSFNLSLVIGIAFAGAMVPLIKQAILSARTKKILEKGAAPAAVKDNEIPVRLLCVIGSIALVAIVIYYKAALNVNPILTLIAELGMVVIAYMDIRSMGESGLTISSVFSLVMIFLIGTILKDPLPTLFVLTISVSMMGLAGDTMTDLKTGQMIGASPKKQMWCQFIGLVPGAILSVLILFLVVKTRGIGTAEAPFPAAAMFYGMAQSAGGIAVLDTIRMLIGAVVGIAVSLFNMPAVAFGMAFYLPIAYIVSIFVGGIVRGILEKKRGAETANVWVNAASGLIISDGFITLIAMAIQFISGR